jgi:hypothetical protein
LGLWCFGSGQYFLKAKPKGLEGPGSDPGFCVTFLGLAHGRGVSGSNLLLEIRLASAGRDLGFWPLRDRRFAASLWCPPPVELDRHLRGRSGSSPRSVLIKICANKKDR